MLVEPNAPTSDILPYEVEDKGQRLLKSLLIPNTQMAYVGSLLFNTLVIDVDACYSFRVFGVSALARRINDSEV